MARTIRELSALLTALGHDELDAIGMLLDRVAEGRKVYGEAVVAPDPRNFVHEALQEALDASFYLGLALLRLEGNERLRNPGPNQRGVSTDPPPRREVPMPEPALEVEPIDEPETWADGTPVPDRKPNGSHP